jgi:hypothetical protein
VEFLLMIGKRKCLAIAGTTGRAEALAGFLSLDYRNARLFQIIDDLKPVVLFCNFAIAQYLKSRRSRSSLY